MIEFSINYDSLAISIKVSQNFHGAKLIENGSIYDTTVCMYWVNCWQFIKKWLEFYVLSQYWLNSEINQKLLCVYWNIELPGSKGRIAWDGLQCRKDFTSYGVLFIEQYQRVVYRSWGSVRQGCASWPATYQTPIVCVIEEKVKLCV